MIKKEQDTSFCYISVAEGCYKSYFLGQQKIHRRFFGYMSEIITFYDGSKISVFVVWIHFYITNVEISFIICQEH